MSDNTCSFCGSIKHIRDNCPQLNQAKEAGAVILGLKEGRKDDSSKLRHDLLSVPVLEEVSKVLTFGASKYGDRNWEAGISFSRVYAASLRHLFSWWSREPRDKETNLNHLAHAICCLMFLLQYEQFSSKYKSFDDRPELWK